MLRHHSANPYIWQLLKLILKMRHFLFVFFTLFFSIQGHAQYWQQRMKCEISLQLNDSTHRYTGQEKLVYYNNSPDTLYHVYFHLYPNAFRPGSMMDVRSRTIDDPDPRVADRISKLQDGEEGLLTVTSLSQNGKLLQFRESQTVLKATLQKPILPGKKTTFTLDFNGQVPAQIRRMGRNNKEGVAYSMAQWYPRIAEYDRLGWHTYPYVAREFHGVWGDFDVKITLDSAYTIAATGVLQNAKQIGKGYLPAGQVPKRPASPLLTWHFRAENVHDFAWGADKEFVHLSRRMQSGTVLRFFFKNSPDLRTNWEKLPELTEKAFVYASENFGNYPYPEYAVVQGGDGGMEYPMFTFITGKRNIGSLIGVTVHEAIHSWYQLIMASNEALYPWMDEGFTTYVSTRVMNHLFEPEADKRVGKYYKGYLALALSGKEEPMARQADSYMTNYAYGAASYDKGAVFVAQLGYIMGEDVLQKALKRYYSEWKFKHPDPFDFIRVMEKTSGMQLYWYLDYMLHTTETIDYGLEVRAGAPDETVLRLSRLGQFPMPVDVDITYMNGQKERINIPLHVMLEAKRAEDATPYRVEQEWPWTQPQYTLTLPVSRTEIAKIEIDASLRMADIDRTNNAIEFNPPLENN